MAGVPPLTRGASAADQVTAALPTPIRIAIHYAAGTDNVLSAMQLAAYLRDQGFEVSDIRPADIEVERPSVRYLFDGDQPGARPLIEAMAAFFAEAPEEEVADLSQTSPKPSEGKVEVWLPPPAAGASPST
jgi:hypothetical protein